MSTDKKKISAYLTHELEGKAKALAASKQMSLSTYIAFLLSREVEAHEGRVPALTLEPAVLPVVQPEVSEPPQAPAAVKSEPPKATAPVIDDEDDEPPPYVIVDEYAGLNDDYEHDEELERKKDWEWHGIQSQFGNNPAKLEEKVAEWKQKYEESLGDLEELEEEPQLSKEEKEQQMRKEVDYINRTYKDKPVERFRAIQEYEKKWGSENNDDVLKSDLYLEPIPLSHLHRRRP